MKIKPEDKAELFRLLDVAVVKIGLPAVHDYRALRRGNDIEKRFRWDLFWAARIKIGNGQGTHGDLNLYAYLNDDHIDTALKAYVRERPQLEIPADHPSRQTPGASYDFHAATEPATSTN